MKRSSIRPHSNIRKTTPPSIQLQFYSLHTHTHTITDMSNNWTGTESMHNVWFWWNQNFCPFCICLVHWIDKHQTWMHPSTDTYCHLNHTQSHERIALICKRGTTVQFVLIWGTEHNNTMVQVLINAGIWKLNPPGLQIPTLRGIALGMVFVLH